jgi:3-methylcrotonyl-CoA carboxylase beta subunit
MTTIMALGMRPAVQELRDRRCQVREGRSESARKKHTERGKLLVRDWVDRFLDPGSPCASVLAGR